MDKERGRGHHEELDDETLLLYIVLSNLPNYVKRALMERLDNKDG